MSKSKSNLNVTTPTTGRSIPANLKLTGSMVSTAIKSGTSKIRGQK
jgi:hypothetical protein